MLARIINGQLQQGLPATGYRKDGRSVSRYDLLSVETLEDEGWKEVIENIPEPSEDEYPVIDSFEDNGTNIVVNYKLEKF